MWEHEKVASGNLEFQVLNDGDNFCLFHALELAREFHSIKLIADEKKQKAEKKAWDRLTQTRKGIYWHRRQMIVHQLLEGIKREGIGAIPTNFEEYSAEEYAPIVQEYYNRRYRYRPKTK